MTSPHRVPPPEVADTPALPRDVVHFLVQFSVALNKSRSYPAAHPVLTAAIGVLLQQLDSVFQHRSTLTIGITRTQLYVDGLPSDESHAVLRDLAEKLHRHQLAGIQLASDPTVEEMSSVLLALAAETWRQGKPLGLEPTAGRQQQWPHVVLEPLPLEQLQIGDDSTTARERNAEAVWQGLVVAALSPPPEEDAIKGTSPALTASEITGTDMARLIKSRRDREYHRQVLEWILKLGEGQRDLESSSELRSRIEALFASFDRETFTNLLWLGATRAERNEIVARSARILPVKAVLDLLVVAAKLASRDLSHPLLQLLTKLADQADSAQSPVPTEAEAVIRHSVRQLLGEWDVDAPAGDSHRDLLELLSQPGSGGTSGSTGKTTTSALSVVRMGFELGVVSLEVEQALIKVRQEIGLAGMLELIEPETVPNHARTAVWQAVADPKFVAGLLLDDATEVTLLETVLDRMGVAAAGAMLDALEQAETAARRKWLLRRIQDFGDAIGHEIVNRLPDKPWYVQRNLLVLLGNLSQLPDGFHADDYASHEDPRVRREAVKLQLRDRATRTDALLRAVADDEPGIVRMALSLALEDCPPALPAKLLELLESTYRDPELRLQAIRLLAQRPTTRSRDWLVSRVGSKRGWGPFKRLRLESKSVEMLTALALVAQHFAKYPPAIPVLSLAEASRDPEIQSAARGVLPKGAA